MKVSDFLELVNSSVFKQLSIESDDALAFINLALLEVYKEFPINIKEQNIILDANINIYKLNDDVMSLVSAYTAEKYLKDSDGELLDNTVDANSIVEININTDNDPNSFNTPTPNMGMVSFPTTEQVISLLYRAGSTRIEPDELDTELEVGMHYIEPLLMYVGYLGHLSVSIASPESSAYLNKYMASVNSIKRLGIVNLDNYNKTKFSDRGFV